MKYFRSYPWGLQVFLFLMMAFVFISVAQLIVYLLLGPLTGVAYNTLVVYISLSTPYNIVRAAIIMQAILSTFIYLLSAFVFASLSHPRPAFFLGFRAPGKPVQLLLVIFVVLGAMPLLNGLEDLISHIDFGARIKAEQKANDDITGAFLRMPDFTAFIRGFIVLAIIPAVGEEMFFRGVLLRFVKQKSRGMVLPILFTAAVFALSHGNIYGYLSIFLAGVLLAVIYNLTGSLWCSIVAHIVNNGTQVILAYLANDNPALKNLMSANTVPWYLLISGAVVFSISFYLLLKNKTPLPPNWSDNFTPQELSQKDITFTS